MSSVISWAYIGLGDVDAVFLWLETACQGGDPLLSGMANYPELDPYRSGSA